MKTISKWLKAFAIKHLGAYNLKVVKEEPADWRTQKLPWHITHHTSGVFTLNVKHSCGHTYDYRYYTVEMARSDVLRMVKEPCTYCAHPIGPHIEI